MLLGGTNITTQTDEVSQAALSTAQLLQYNSHRTAKSGKYHHKTREPPLPVYVGVTVHSRTRKRDLIDTLFELGLSISYRRVMEISTSLGNRVCEQYIRDQTVCPPNLREALFTTAAVDNIDHNLSSTTATDSFHGTGISLFQHPSSPTSGSGRREQCSLQPTSTIQSRRLSDLPESYTSVRPFILTRKDTPIPAVDTPVKGDGRVFQQALSDENGLVLWMVDTIFNETSAHVRHHLLIYSNILNWHAEIVYRTHSTCTSVCNVFRWDKYNLLHGNMSFCSFHC